MFTAFKAVLNGCFWALVGFAMCSLLGFLLVPLGLIDYFVKGEVGQELEATPLGVMTHGLFVVAGFLWGIRLTYKPLLRRRPAGNKPTPNKGAAPNGGPVTRIANSGGAEGPPSVS